MYGRGKTPVVFCPDPTCMPKPVQFVPEIAYPPIVFAVFRRMMVTEGGKAFLMKTDHVRRW